MKNSSAYALPAPTNPLTSGLEIVNRDEVGCGDQDRNRVFHEALDGAARFITAVLASAASTWCVTSMMSMSFESGYELVKSVVGQPQSSQGVVAGMSLWFVVMPYAFALVFGALKKLFSASRFWDLAPLVLVSSAAMIGIYADGDLQAVLEMMPWIVLSCVVAYGGYFAGQRILSSFSKTASCRLLLAGIACCIPAGILCALSINLHSSMELALCAGTVFSGAVFIALRSTATKLSSCLMIVAGAMAPILIPLLVNAALTTALVVLEQFGYGADLGWRACASAITLLIGTVISGTAGGVLGRTYKMKGAVV